MEERRICVAFCAGDGGALQGDYVWYWTLPFAMTLIEVSAVASNDSDATLKIGNSSDAEAYLEECTIGDSGTPVTKTASDFVDEVAEYIAADTVLVITLDYDGEGTAANDVTIVLTFISGA